jgi:hypothetical protein
MRATDTLSTADTYLRPPRLRLGDVASKLLSSEQSQDYESESMGSERVLFNSGEGFFLEWCPFGQ